jgi:hypothetical protein
MSHSTTAPRRGSQSGAAWTALPPDIPLTTSDTWAAHSPQPNHPPDHRDHSHDNSAKILRPTSHVNEQEALLSVESSHDPHVPSGSPSYHPNGRFAATENILQEHSNNPRGEWKPFTLRPAFLRTMAIVTLALAVTLAILCWYSARHNGLQSDTDTASLLFARRFLPTILAVVLTQALVIISNDIKRTEPFARLARPGEPNAKHTLFYKSKAWWSAIRDGLVRRRNSGHIGWVLVLSSLATGISLLAVSTLSSSLLASEQIISRSSVDMKRFIAARIALVPRREVNFHATSSFLFNATTSMWVSDSHVVSPFGPSDLYNHPDFLPEGNWNVKTDVHQLESSCKPMRFAQFDSIYQARVYETYDPPGAHIAYNSASNRSYARYLMNQTASRNTQGFTLDSDDGCRVQVLGEMGTRGDHRIVQNGGLLWTNLTASYVTYNQFVRGRGTPPFFRTTEWSPMDTGLMFDFSKDCIGRSLLLVTTPWINSTNSKVMDKQGFKVRAEVCSYEMFKATMNVSASISSGSKSLTLDGDALLSQRTQLASNHYGMDFIQELIFGRDKLGYVDRAKTLMSNYVFEGLSETLSAAYSFNTSSMLEAGTLADDATRLSKRFFGELMLSAISSQKPDALVDVPGEATRAEQRIVVVTETAATLSALLFFLFCYLMFLARNAAARRRPLGLRSDPATVLGLGAYLLRHTYLNMIKTAKDQDEQIDVSPRLVSTVADKPTEKSGITVKLKGLIGRLAPCIRTQLY